MWHADCNNLREDTLLNLAFLQNMLNSMHVASFLRLGLVEGQDYVRFMCANKIQKYDSHIRLQ
jgi:hypothetical protein